MLQRIFFLFGFCFSTLLWAQDEVVRLGQDQVIIHTEGTGGQFYVHLHQNESTALDAARAVMKAQGGRLLTLQHAGGRNIVFHYQGQRYEFDPNRIFTDAGIKKTMTQFGAYSLPAHHLVRQFAGKIIAKIPAQEKIIALHNNNGYSIRNYLPGQDMEGDVSAINLLPHQYFRNFFVVTQPEEYLRLKNLGFNEVLQSTTVSDDGSLSVFLSRHNYVNVEAGYDQLQAQIKMIRSC